jgi:hypothetical protein
MLPFSGSLSSQIRPPWASTIGVNANFDVAHNELAAHQPGQRAGCDENQNHPREVARHGAVHRTKRHGLRNSQHHMDLTGARVWGKRLKRIKAIDSV